MNSSALEGLPQFHSDGQGIARIRLHRPDHRNALRPADLQHLLALFTQVNSDARIRVLVLEAEQAQGSRPVFCSGFDVAGFSDPQHDPRLFERVADALAGLRPLTLCALSGSAYGGATDLVLACDLRVAVLDAELRMPATALGLHYYPNGLRRFAARLGPELARRAFLAGRSLTASELQAAGLFDAMVASSDFAAAVADLTTRVLRLAPLAAQSTKQSLRELEWGEFDLARLQAREAQTLSSADFAEGRRAFAEGRAPVFEGK